VDGGRRRFIDIQASGFRLVWRPRR